MTKTTAERILSGAHEAVAEHGVRPMTVQHILDAAGVSRRTFYKHFSCKEDALRAVYEGYVGQLVTGVTEALQQAEGPADQVTAAATAYLDYLDAGGPVLWRLKAEAVGSDSLLAPDRERSLDRLCDVINDSLYRVVRQRLDPLVFRSLLIGIEGLALYTFRKGEYDRDRILQVIKPLWLQALAGVAHLPKLADVPDA
jgi:AcrR family transcriptional regulator